MAQLPDAKEIVTKVSGKVSFCIYLAPLQSSKKQPVTLQKCQWQQCTPLETVLDSP
jgi:hypothetical protein